MKKQRYRSDYKKEYDLKNKEKIRAYYLEYYQKNKERIAAYRKKHRQDANFKKKIKKYQAEYHKKNPHKARENMRRRRARLREVHIEIYTEAQVLKTYGCTCYICGVEINLDAPRKQGESEGWEMGLHIDHIVPISRGGSDTLENVRPTHAICNLRKGPIQIAVQKRKMK